MVVTQLALPYAAAPYVDIAATNAFDNANGMTLQIDGGTMIFWRNQSGGALTFTITSIADPYGRTKDITAHSIPDTNFCYTGEFPQVGWNSGSGNLMNVDASGALRYLALQRAPGT